MRKFAKQMLALVPDAAKLAKRRKWFSPERNDFPIGLYRLTPTDFMSSSERMEYTQTTLSRCDAMRMVIESKEILERPSHEQLWERMFAPDKAPPHPSESMVNG